MNHCHVTAPTTRNVTKRVSAQGRHALLLGSLLATRFLTTPNKSLQTRQRTRQVHLHEQRLRNRQLQSARLHQRLWRLERMLLDFDRLR